jgi:hypothetical protein
MVGRTSIVIQHVVFELRRGGETEMLARSMQALDDTSIGRQVKLEMGSHLQN